MLACVTFGLIEPGVRRGSGRPGVRGRTDDARPDALVPGTAARGPGSHQATAATMTRSAIAPSANQVRRRTAYGRLSQARPSWSASRWYGSLLVDPPVP